MASRVEHEYDYLFKIVLIRDSGVGKSNSTVALLVLLFTLSFTLVHGGIPTTLEGPFKPVTVPLDKSFRGNAVDLPDADPRVQRIVKGFEPEQISVSLSATHDSVWISWITGEFQIGDDIKPLDPETVPSVVVYGRYGSPMANQSTGYSLVYNQLYQFEGLQNYTSGIIHHVLLTGEKRDSCFMDLAQKSGLVQISWRSNLHCKAA